MKRLCNNRRMPGTPLRFAAIGILIMAAGCTSTVFKPFEVDGPPRTSVSIDARQRVILATAHGGPDNNRHIICAEPSPDAIMALAAGGSADASAGGESIRARAAVAETVGAIAPRTQTIQLLRDGLYRACEAYMNGVLDKDDYRQILVAYDEVLITLVALEGLGRRDIRTGPKLTVGANSGNESEPATANKATLESLAAPASAAIEAEAVRKIHAIVRDYFCMQIGFKELFTRSDAEFDPTILATLCDSAGTGDEDGS